MAEDAWIRRAYQRGAPAFVHFVVVGTSPARLGLSRSKHRVRGVPDAVTVTAIRRGEPSFIDLVALVPEALAPPELRAAVADSDLQTVVVAELEDAVDLLELRDVLGLVTALSEGEGAVAVLDTQTLCLRDPAAWRDEVFAPDAPLASAHIAFLASEEEDGMWLHTRGLRKFGRPDLSIRALADEELEPAAAVLQRFADFFIAGGVPDEGREVTMAGWPDGWRLHLAGDLDDPDFNNVHVEIVRP